MPVKTISTFNGVTQAAGAATNLIISTNSLPVIRAIYGYCNGTANAQYFLHFFNSTTIPANGTVPLRSLQVLGGDGFGPYNYVEAGLDPAQWDTGGALVTSSGLIVCLSSTEATLTIGTGGVTMDIEVDIDTEDLPLLGQTAVGDLTTPVATFQTVVADPSTSLLTSFNCKNLTAGTRYLMLFGKSPVNGDAPVQEWTVLAGVRFIQSFGRGWAILQGGSDYVIHTGIYLAWSTQAQTLSIGVNAGTVQANYL